MYRYPTGKGRALKISAVVLTPNAQTKAESLEDSFFENAEVRILLAFGSRGAVGRPYAINVDGGYWTASEQETDEYGAHSMFFYDNNFAAISGYAKRGYRSIRPFIKK